jgi:prepilin-type N-terminal cleavage/methylation domain-containing protein
VTGERGFTLLELLVSLAIAAILVATQVAPFQRTIASRDRAERAMEQASGARLTLQRLAEEVSGALPLAGEGREFRLVDRTLDEPSSELSFATSNAQRVHGGARDPVQMVRYYLEPMPLAETTRGAARGLRLVKEQGPSVAAPEVEPMRIALLDDVLRFRVRVMPPSRSGTEWLDTWSGSPEGGKEELPRAVEFELAVRDGSRSSPVYRLAIELPLGASSR